MSAKHRKRNQWIREQKLARRNFTYSHPGIKIRTPEGMLIPVGAAHGSLFLRGRRPHIGAKEQARAARCYMDYTFPRTWGLRSAPVMCQSAK